MSKDFRGGEGEGEGVNYSRFSLFKDRRQMLIVTDKTELSHIPNSC